MGARVDFYYSIGSRYAYLASSRLAALADETGCSVEWRPLNSVRLLARRGASPFQGSPVSGQYEWPYRERDAARWASLYGVPFVEPRGRVEFDPELLALACTAAKRLDAVERYSHQLFAAMFDGSLAQIGESECLRRAEACGLEAADLERELHSAETRRQLETETDSALASGVFGVPTFVAHGELFFGNDRLPLLRHHLMQRLTATGGS